MASKRCANPQFSPGHFISYHICLNGSFTFGSDSANPGSEDISNSSDTPDELETFCTINCG